MTTVALEIVSATPAHAPVLAELHARSFADQGREPWDAKTMRRAVCTAGGFAMIGITAGTGQASTPIGFALGRAIAGESELFSIGALPEWRRNGVASRLLSAFEAEAAARGAANTFLEVAEDNAAALALYRRHGYGQVGRRESYYRGPNGPVAALVLESDLTLR